MTQFSELDSTSNDESNGSNVSVASESHRCSESKVERRDFMKATGVAATLGALGSWNATAVADSDAVNTKTRPTIWTIKDRQNARKNIQQYDWAKSQRDSAVASADAYLDRYGGLDNLWYLIPAQTVPRSAFTSPDYHWNNEFYDSWNTIGESWKMTDGEYVFPTNDFAAYRESGRDDRGMFDPDLADDQFLVNEEHPEMGEGWGVDDGYGWQDMNDDLGQGEGAWWTFVAYYNHWAVWRPGGVVNMMRAFTDAYLLSGDQKYSRACAVLLDRIADVYPEMDVSKYRDPRAGGHYHNITGGRQTGKILGANWEPNLIRPVLRAYDAIFPGMEGDQQLINFLNQKTVEYPGLSDKSSVGEIRKNIEDGLVREILPAAKRSQLTPRRGQLPTVTISARVLDEPDGYTREALEWVFQPGEEIFTGDVWYAEPENWATTGGNVMVKLVDVVGRDGYFDQGSVLYNPISQASVIDIGDLLEGYDGFDGADLYDHPKFHRTMHTQIPLIMLDKFTPIIGDTHPNRLYLNQSSKRNAFEVYAEDIFAQTLHFANGFTTDGLRGDIFSEDPTQLRKAVQAVIDAEGPLDMDSTILSSYGFTALRDGKNHEVMDGGGGDETYSFLSLPIVDQSTAIQRYEDDGYIQLEPIDGNRHHITFEFEVSESGSYYLGIRPYVAMNYGRYKIELDGKRVEVYDFYHPSSRGKSTFDVIGDKVQLSAGTHTLTFRNVGKHPESRNHKFGIYQLELRDTSPGKKTPEIHEKGNAKRGIWTYYGRTGKYGQHTHRDALHLGVMAHELNLAPDNGYPTLTGSWPRRRYFNSNTIAHNTVMVDKRRQEGHRVGEPKHFDHTEMVQLTDVAAPDVYPQTDEYRRTTAMVRVDHRDSYAVDFFRVEGGDDHRFSFHGWDGDVATTGLDLIEQDGGTYAGPDVPKPENVANPDSKYNEKVGNGFNYLDNVARDRSPSTKASVDWDIEDYWNNRDDDADVHLRLTMLGDYDEIAVMDGYTPDRNEQPETLKYTITRRSGSDLSSTFTSVIEPYVSKRFVESIEEVPVEMVPREETGELPEVFKVEEAVPASNAVKAVKVELTDGRTDYIVKTDGSDTLYTIDRRFQVQGFFAVISVKNDDPLHAYLNDGTLIRPLHIDEDDEPVEEYEAGRPLVQQPYGRFTGTVEDFTREFTLKNQLEIKVDGHQNDFERAVGGQIYVDTDGLVNGVYPIQGVQNGERNSVSVDVGERTTIESFTDPERLDDGGYEYYLKEGDEFYVPLSATWSAD